MSSRVSLETIVSLAKRRGFIYQGSEIYGGLAGTWDYGPLGVQLKRNLVNLWWKMFVEDRDDMFGIDTAILMNPKVWQASGHTATFSDPLVECANCHERFRADKIDLSKCPACGQKGSLGEPRLFNMMFQTQVGPAADRESLSYLRPETAQGMFVNFKNIVDSFAPDLPFGVAQVGRAFRNEISPRDFIFRAREFEIMELEYFVRPEEWQKHFESWRGLTGQWFKAIGLPAKRIQEIELPAGERAHYSQATVDFYYDFPSIGPDELAGLAYRGDFDLANHQAASGKKLEYRLKDGSQTLLPHVIEPTFGLDRNLMAVLSEAYAEDSVGGEKRVVLKLPTHLAPVRYAISPLLRNKPELVEKARQVFGLLKRQFGLVMWDDSGNIGKRYRRQDEIGTPYCVVIDFQTLQDGTVTVRHRDTTRQERIVPEKFTDFS